MFKKILVPLDGSTLSTRAVAPAYALAGPDSELILLHVVDGVRIAAALNTYETKHFWPDEPSRKYRAAAGYLASVRAGLPADSNVDGRVVDGEVVSGITHTAQEAQADLIVMASHGYADLTRWVLGSVAEKVVHAAPCPVLVVRGIARFNKVLVTLDGTPFAEQALAPALAIAAALHSSVTLLQIVTTVTPNDLRQLDERGTWLSRQIAQEQLTEAEAYLCRLAAQYNVREAFKVVVPAAQAAEAIARYCQAHEVGLVAMATHQYTGLQRWAQSSATDRVLHAVASSMLVVRPPVTELAVAPLESEAR